MEGNNRNERVSQKVSQSVGNLVSQPTGAWDPAVRKSISCIVN